jgi:hypothetical protein
MYTQPPGYELTSQWFAFAKANTDKVNPLHTALYLWLVERNKGMSWRRCFPSPASETMAGICVKRYETYKKALDDLVSFGFVQVVSASINQHSSNIIALLKNSIAPSDRLGIQLKLALKVSSHYKYTKKASVISPEQGELWPIEDKAHNYEATLQPEPEQASGFIDLFPPQAARL